jgi:16S rRNA (cytosine967-C5)-methyltransferase
MAAAGLTHSNNRAIAAMAIDRVLRHGQALDGALKDVTFSGLSARDLSQVKALSFGALRWHHRNRLIIDQLLQRPLRARDKILEALLSIGLFQLEDARQPQYAAVSATVEASRHLKKSRAAGLINAALRRFQRERDSVMQTVLEDDEGRYSHPQWFIDRLRHDWPGCWREILLKMLEHPPLWIRVNTQRQTRDDYAAGLRASTGMRATTLPGFQDALRLERPIAVGELPGFSEGLVSIQDAASQLATEMLAPEQDMLVLDACAAPGGKATHLLERARGQIRLVAVDMDEDRNALLRSNLDRIGFDADVRTADVLDIDAWFNGELFDRILIDAPCSATGVIRRHPDIKFLRRAEDIPAFAERQLAMLEKLWTLLKPGGRLLYSTCSLLTEENSGVVSSFLQRCADAQEIRALSGRVLRVAAGNEGPGYQLLPGPAEIDGFYYALMERRPDD